VRTVLVTGSTDGIGRHTAVALAQAGHRVVVHARNDRRAEDARRDVPSAAAVVVGDLASLGSTRSLAEQIIDAGPPDVVIHNAGVQAAAADERQVTDDGLESTFQINVLAPYLLTALLPCPERLVWLTSGLEPQGEVDFGDLQHEGRPWDGMQAYSDSKLCDIVLAFAVARQWQDVSSNAVDPGWIKTRMGGAQATDDLPEGSETQIWLATSEDGAATVSGCYFKRRQKLRASPSAYDADVQDGLLAACARLSGVELSM
jgi:NAD(P)-dependent dehydrogenase (short-subunit alcohol dehydrogenase family)